MTYSTDTALQPGRLRFFEAAPQGFGDRNNSWPWAMRWWRGKLYVGTNRAWSCVERAAVHASLPMFARYPPNDADTACTANPHDLPLQAEIWCWTPETASWERVYQSPLTVPIPDGRGKMVAREIGFRGIEAFTDPDGTEALYVSGVCSKFIYRRVPPPTLLRSTDGRTFTPVPQTPGTTFGSLDKSAFRTILSYKGRLFVTHSSVKGDGPLLEASNPAAGNNAFRIVSPPNMRIFEMAVFHGYLYIGLRDPRNGYAVLKTDASGSPPYTFTPVVQKGAYLLRPSMSVISMFAFKDQLYVGTDRPAELIRINPDDSWELVLGTPRETPQGWKYPLASLDAGFSSWLNGHIWRMEAHNDKLYVGTMSMSTRLRELNAAQHATESNLGFHLYESNDGAHFAPITRSGFGDTFCFGLRSFASTPHGLFVGGINNAYGLRIWRGVDLPDTKTPMAPTPPERLMSERVNGAILLSWEPAPNATAYRILRATLSDQRAFVNSNPLIMRILRVLRTVLSFQPNLYLPRLPDQIWVPGAFSEVGTSSEPLYHDTTTSPAGRYIYYVEAEGNAGRSAPSNIIAVPDPAPPVTPAFLRTQLPATTIPLLAALETAVQTNDAAGAADAWIALEAGVSGTLRLLVNRLHRRAQLVQKGYLTSWHAS